MATKRRQVSWTPADTATGSPHPEAQPERTVAGIEQEWHQRLCSLEQWICELLIKNERLRMSLASTEAASDRDSKRPEGPTN
jgi:hypothetical protein